MRLTQDYDALDVANKVRRSCNRLLCFADHCFAAEDRLKRAVAFADRHYLNKPVCLQLNASALREGTPCTRCTLHACILVALSIARWVC